MRQTLILGVALALMACTPAADTPPAASVAAVENATVTVPESGARVTSPLRVSGVAPADWFFENQFPVQLIDAEGRMIAEAPAHPRINWTEPGPKEYDAELHFDVYGPATLVLQEDMPGDGQTPREVRVPVVLAPN